MQSESRMHDIKKCILGEMLQAFLATRKKKKKRLNATAGEEKKGGCENEERTREVEGGWSRRLLPPPHFPSKLVFFLACGRTEKEIGGQSTTHKKEGKHMQIA